MRTTISFVLLVSTQAQADLSSGLVANYRFSGNTQDSSGNGWHASANGPTLVADRLGKPGKAYEFDGIDDRIVGPAAAMPTGSASRTVSVWFKASSRNPALAQLGGAGVFNAGRTITGRRFGMDVLHATGTAYYVGQNADLDTQVVVDDNSWHHAVVTYDGSVVRCYIDGQPTGSKSLALDTASAPFSIGSIPDDHPAYNQLFFKGAIDDVRIYGRSLSETEAKQLFTAEVFCSPHAARGIATVNGGTVTAISLTDFGCGYATPPTIRIVGGGGSGATAIAVIEEGIVTAINITNAGSGYTSAPRILIESPPFVPTTSISVSRVNVTQRVRINHNYILEASPDLLNWSATGPQFTAESEEITNEFIVDPGNRFFRIREVP